MGKPIGNGHPMSAVVTTREVADAFNNGMEYFNTFAGNPVSCAVGLAVLDAIERDQLKENALNVGHYLLEGLRKLQQQFDVIGDVRGLGLFLGVVLVTDRQSKAPATALARKVADGARERGVLIGTEGPHDNVLKMRPSMIFSRTNADFLRGAERQLHRGAEIAFQRGQGVRMCTPCGGPIWRAGQVASIKRP